MNSIVPSRIKVTRLGVVLEPQGPSESEGILNPAGCLTRKKKLLLLARAVEKGNRSRIRLVEVKHRSDDSLKCKRLGFALTPTTAAELNGASGEGCEDPRVTYMPIFDRYLMTLTAYGPEGPRIELAVSKDAYVWERIGLVEFPPELKLHADDKDAAFFPEPVFSPSGQLSIAMYHRPMVHVPMTAGEDEIQSVLASAAEARQSIRIAYTPLSELKEALKTRGRKKIKALRPLTRPTESTLVMAPSKRWGSVKVGAGSAPVLINEGWLSVYHGVDAVAKPGGGYQMQYSAGIVVHDRMFPHRIVYRSAKPILKPETPDELSGTVNSVVFPTLLVPRFDVHNRAYDGYYGMADNKIGRFRLELPASLYAR